MTRSEIVVAGAMAGHAWDFHHAHETELAQHRTRTNQPGPEAPQELDVVDSPAVTRIAFHSFCGDATNAKVFHGAKVHSCLLTSAYLHDPNAWDEDRPISDAMHVADFLADIQVVQDSTTAGAHGMLSKQLASLGCKSWRELSHVQGSQLAAQPVVVDVYCYTSDRGPDQE